MCTANTRRRRAADASRSEQGASSLPSAAALHRLHSVLYSLLPCPRVCQCRRNFGAHMLHTEALSLKLRLKASIDNLPAHPVDTQRICPFSPLPSSGARTNAPTRPTARPALRNVPVASNMYRQRCTGPTTFIFKNTTWQCQTEGSLYTEQWSVASVHRKLAYSAT